MYAEALPMPRVRDFLSRDAAASWSLEGLADVSSRRLCDAFL